MITKIEARRYRCLRDVQQSLKPFHVLIGPNASGKTTFLDTVSFLRDFVTEDLDEAISKRSRNFQDLLWNRSGESFELAIEIAVPEPLRKQFASSKLRYEVELGYNDDENELEIRNEKAFGFDVPPLAASVSTPRAVLSRTAVRSFYFESSEQHEGVTLRTGSRRSSLANVPGDEVLLPVANWLKSFLSEGVKSFSLDSHVMRLASAPGQSRGFKTDGSNLPWVVATLQEKHPERFQDWISHVQTALPDLTGARVVDRPDDRHRYLMIQYRGGLEVPSWTTSDGTLRLMALTLLAYLPELEGVYLVEEPENGIHPRAIETVYRSLSNVYDAQVLLATHSPIILGLVEPAQLLCFAKNDQGATEIVLGSEHPRLRDWHKEVDLATLFAAGVLD